MRCAVFAVVGLVLTTAVAADELAEARGALEKAGIRASATGVVLAKEAELTKELAKAAGLKRNVLQTDKELKSAELQYEGMQRGMTQLRQQHIQLSAQLANINPNDIALNNKLVSAIKVVEGQLDLAKDQRTTLETQVKNSRARANEAREAYIELAISARGIADEIEAEYRSKGADADVKAALERFNKAAGKQFTLSPTAALTANLRRLKQLEETVLSDSIELRDEGKTMRVNVVVNGKYPEEMVLDSGASLISLPPAVAAKLGLRPTEKDPRIVLQLADGREIDGRLMKLASVRVGKFTVENVECAVLGEGAIAAEPLLGMSFLEHFKFEIDAAGRKLTMVKVAGTEGAVGKK
jgi:clan AA aspartic protease (TIGR02281 family)